MGKKFTKDQRQIEHRGYVIVKSGNPQSEKVTVWKDGVYIGRGQNETVAKRWIDFKTMPNNEVK